MMMIAAMMIMIMMVPLYLGLEHDLHPLFSVVVWSL